jgi:hypothetical protein
MKTKLDPRMVAASTRGLAWTEEPEAPARMTASSQGDLAMVVIRSAQRDWDVGVEPAAVELALGQPWRRSKSRA